MSTARKAKGAETKISTRRDPADARSRVGNLAVERLVEHSRQAPNAEEDALHQRGSDDPAADAAAHLLDAEAATVRGHVIRSRDAPQPNTPAGERLLSHELAHVLQQRRADNLTPNVGERASRLETDADMAAAGRGSLAAPVAAVPAVQREEKGGAADKPQAQPSKHPVVEQRLTAYFKRVCEAQKSESVRTTAEVTGDVKRLALGDVNTMLRLDAYFTAIGAREPAAMAREIARLLPDTFDAKRSAYLESLPVEEAPKSRTQRGIDLVKKTEPYVSPEAQQQQWEFDRRAKEARANQDVVGPYGVDVLRAARIAQGVPGVLSPEPKKTVPPPIAETTESVIGTLDDAQLIPKAARGTAKGNEYALASDVARDVARKFADAKKRKVASFEIRLGANYKTAEDRFEILDALERIVRRVAETMPNEAAEVSEVWVYFGDIPARKIPMRK